MGELAPAAAAHEARAGAAAGLLLRARLARAGAERRCCAQFSSGAVYCQVLDAFYDEAVAMHKVGQPARAMSARCRPRRPARTENQYYDRMQVNFFAREEHEAVPNYKQLQAAFAHLKIVKASDGAAVEPLPSAAAAFHQANCTCRRRPQELNVLRMAKGAKADTLELLQFMHKTLTRECQCA
jgi:hypothetical protein